MLRAPSSDLCGLSVDQKTENFVVVLKKPEVKMMRYNRGSGKFYRGDAMDEYLNKLGLVRKVNAKDESSLFRAVAEQVYLTQQHHAEIKEVVLNAIEISRAGMEQLPGFSKIYNMLATLATVLRHDVVIYRELGKAPFNVLGSSRYANKVVLCESFGGYYDSVNMRSMHEKLGVAQSIVYEMLYEGVFGVPKEQIAGAVKLIRNRPHSFPIEQRVRTRSFATARDGSSSDQGSSELESSNEHGGSGESMDRPPFPFKVAKALDPAIYRNIEYDSWLEQRKVASIEMMLRDQAMAASSPFPPGMRCMLRDGPAIRHGVVQKILDDNGRTVFFADKGEMRDLAVSDLRPLPPELLRAQFSSSGDQRPQSESRRMTDGSISNSVRRRQRRHEHQSAAHTPPTTPIHRMAAGAEPMGGRRGRLASEPIVPQSLPYDHTQLNDSGCMGFSQDHYGFERTFTDPSMVGCYVDCPPVFMEPPPFFPQQAVLSNGSFVVAPPGHNQRELSVTNTPPTPTPRQRMAPGAEPMKGRRERLGIEPIVPQPLPLDHRVFQFNDNVCMGFSPDHNGFERAFADPMMNGCNVDYGPPVFMEPQTYFPQQAVLNHGNGSFVVPPGSFVVCPPGSFVVCPIAE